MKNDFEFYVLNYDHNRQEVYHYNIFNNVHVKNSTAELLKDYKKNKISSIEEFTEELKNIVAWQERSRREYEISVSDAFLTDIDKLEKWDCYSQFEPNARIVAEYLINNFT